MSTAVSPLAPKSYPELPQVGGVRFATASAGIKYKGRTDVFLALMDGGAEVAGVFTRSRCPSAAVDWCRANLAGGTARALLVNSGNANAFTGRKGREATELSARYVSDALGCAPGEVFLASTGVIGEPLRAEKFAGVVDDLARDAVAGDWQAAAKAIMTTDTFPKAVSRSVDLGGTPVVLNGIAKGAGMIAPDMATMLSFLFTDAPIAAPVLQALLSGGVGKTFNAITVDSDTSTSDTLLMFATGAAEKRGAPRIDSFKDPRLSGFKRALGKLLKSLATMMIHSHTSLVLKLAYLQVSALQQHSKAKS